MRFSPAFPGADFRNQRNIQSGDIPHQFRQVVFDGIQFFFGNFQNQFVTPQTASINARAVFDNKGNSLYSGQFVRVYVKGYYVPNIIQVPLKAILQASEKSFVYKLNDENTAEKVEITILRTIDNTCLVGKGLEEGERIVLDGVGKVRPGEKVAVEGAK